MDFYLISGFLGAGKTTFLKNFVRLFLPRQIHLIINEFGREGVDGALLQEIGAELDEICNGSIFCSCRLDRFEDALKKAVQSCPDVILTEASGLADPTGIAAVLHRFPQIQYRGCICLADAVRLPKVFSTAQVCRRQLAVSSLVLLNKTDLATPQQLEETTNLILQTNPGAKIMQTRFGSFERSWLSLITAVSEPSFSDAAPDITLQKTCLLVDSRMTSDSMQHCLVQLSDSCYRIKGFVQLADGTFFADCTGPSVQLSVWNGKANNRLVLLAGKGMPLRKTVQSALHWYEGYLSTVADTE